MRLHFQVRSLRRLAIALVCVGTGSAAAAQEAENCTLAGKFIDLGDAQISFSLNKENLPKPTPAKGAEKAAEEDDFFGDGVAGSGQAGGCEGGGMVNAIRCQVTKPIMDASSRAVEATRQPSGVIVDNSDPGVASEGGLQGKSGEEEEEPSQLAGSDAKISIPVKRYLMPGDPARVFTVPAGRPKLTAKGPLTKGDVAKLQSALKSNLEALGKKPHVLSQTDLGQLYQGGSGYQIGLTPPDAKSILTYAPTSAGARLRTECLSHVKQRAEMDQLRRAIGKKARECNTIQANIKSRKRPPKDANLFEQGVNSFLNLIGADEAIERLEKNHAECKKDLGVLNATLKELKERNEKRFKRMAQDQYERDIAAIKADPKQLAQEEKIREARAIGKRAAMEEHLAKMQKGMELYNSNMRAFDRMIVTLEASDDPEKDEKLAILKRERQRYNDAYASWLERMNAIADRREKDFNLEIEQNAKDGIGPGSYRDLRKRLSDRGLNPTQVINERFGDSLRFAERQARRDRETLGGDTTTGQSSAELLGEVVKDYYTMSPSERARRLVTYGPDALEGIAEGTAEGVEGLYKLVKGTVDLVPEAAGFEGFEGSSTGFLVGVGDKLSDSFTRGTDGRTNTKDRFENFSNNFSKFASGVDDKFNRGLEKMAGSGEKGTKEAVKAFAKGGTMVVGGEAALLQSASRFNNMLRAVRGLDLGSDAVRAGDAAADLAKAGDAAGDAQRAGDAAADANRVAGAAGDATRTTPPVDDLTRTTPPADDLTRTTPPVDDLTRTTPGSMLDDATRTASGQQPVNPRDLGAPSLDLGPARKFRQGSKSRKAQDMLDAAGVDSQLGRVSAARAAERTVDEAVAAGLYEHGMAPKTLIDKGLATERSMRSGMGKYLDELNIPKGEQGPIIDRFMNRKPGENVWQRGAAQAENAGQTAGQAVDAGKATQRMPEAVASGADAGRATQRLPEAVASGADAGKATQRLPEAVASGADAGRATQRLPEAVASGADAGKATQRLPEAVASGADAGRATQRLPEAVASGADAGKATQRLPEAVASGADAGKATQRLPDAVASGADAGKATPRLPEAVANGADAGKATQRIPTDVASGAGASRPTRILPESAATALDDPITRRAGRFSREELARRLGERANDASPSATQRLPEAVASGANAGKATQRLPEAVASGTDAGRATQRLPKAVASGADAGKATQRLPEAVASGADAGRATQRLPEAVASGVDAGKATQRLPEAVASGADAGRATQRLPGAVASGADAGKATQRLPEAVASGANAGRATQRLPEAVASGADAGKATQRLPEAVASGADAGKATQRLPEAVASGADAGRATQRLPEAVASGVDAGKATQRLPEAVASGVDANRATQILSQPAARAAEAAGDATQILPPGTVQAAREAADATQWFGNAASDVDPIMATARRVEGGYELEHAGRKIRLDDADKLGEGVTSAVYGREGKPVALKLSADDLGAQGLDNLGRSAMEGRLPLPEVYQRYRLTPDSQLPTRNGPTGGMLSVVEKAPASFEERAAALLKKAQEPGKPQRATMPAPEADAILTAAKKMTDNGFVLGDLKSNNFGLRAAEDLTHGKPLEFVPLDDGMVIKLRDEFKHMAAEIQDIILNPGEIYRGLSDDLALLSLRNDLSQFDHMVDWVAMNGGRLDGPFSTLGGGSGALTYTPSLGIQFRGLTR